MKPQVRMSVATVFAVTLLAAPSAYSGSENGVRTAMLLDNDGSRASAIVAITQERSKSSVLPLMNSPINRLFPRRMSPINEVGDPRGSEFDSHRSFSRGSAFPIPAGMDYHQHNSTVSASSPVPLVVW